MIREVARPPPNECGVCGYSNGKPKKSLKRPAACRALGDAVRRIFGNARLSAAARAFARRRKFQRPVDAQEIIVYASRVHEQSSDKRPGKWRRDHLEVAL